MKGMPYGYDEDEDFADEPSPAPAAPKGNLIAAIMAALSRNPPNPKPPVPQKPLDIGMNEDVTVKGQLQRDLPDIETLRRIWLGSATEPPTGTHITPGPPNVSNQLPPKARLAWKQVQQDYPYAAGNVSSLRPYLPDDMGELGNTGPFGTLISNRIDDDELLYNTLMHELVHSGQMNNYPDEKWLLGDHGNAELPAYGVEDPRDDMPDVIRDLLAKKRKK